MSKNFIRTLAIIGFLGILGTKTFSSTIILDELADLVALSYEPARSWHSLSMDKRDKIVMDFGLNTSVEENINDLKAVNSLAKHSFGSLGLFVEVPETALEPRDIRNANHTRWRRQKFVSAYDALIHLISKNAQTRDLRRCGLLNDYEQLRHQLALRLAVAMGDAEAASVQQDSMQMVLSGASMYLDDVTTPTQTLNSGKPAITLSQGQLVDELAESIAISYLPARSWMSWTPERRKSVMVSFGPTTIIPELQRELEMWNKKRGNEERGEVGINMWKIDLIHQPQRLPGHTAKTETLFYRSKREALVALISRGGTREHLKQNNLEEEYHSAKFDLSTRLSIAMSDESCLKALKNGFEEAEAVYLSNFLGTNVVTTQPYSQNSRNVNNLPNLWQIIVNSSIQYVQEKYVIHPDRVKTKFISSPFILPGSIDIQELACWSGETENYGTRWKYVNALPDIMEYLFCGPVWPLFKLLCLACEPAHKVYRCERKVFCCDHNVVCIQGCCKENLLGESVTRGFPSSFCSCCDNRDPLDVHVFLKAIVNSDRINYGLNDELVASSAIQMFQKYKRDLVRRFESCVVPGEYVGIIQQPSCC